MRLLASMFLTHMRHRVSIQTPWQIDSKTSNQRRLCAKLACKHLLNNGSTMCDAPDFSKHLLASV
jgi:hypothetical protein